MRYSAYTLTHLRMKSECWGSCDAFTDCVAKVTSYQLTPTGGIDHRTDARFDRRDTSSVSTFVRMPWLALPSPSIVIHWEPDLASHFFPAGDKP